MVLSGGEPFEHPEILKILTSLPEVTTPFRIATGGFVKFDLWIEQLQILSKQNTAFKGISMGTDVLSNRINQEIVNSWVERKRFPKNSLNVLMI